MKKEELNPGSLKGSLSLLIIRVGGTGGTGGIGGTGGTGGIGVVQSFKIVTLLKIIKQGGLEANACTELSIEDPIKLAKWVEPATI